MVKKDDVIVLVNPPNKQIVLRDMYSSTISKGYYNWPCVDLLVLSGILKEYYDVRLIDANTLGLSSEEAVGKISSFNPKGVIFSLGSSVGDEDYEFIKKLRKQLPGIKFCGTGGLLYHNAKQELKDHVEFDACLRNFTTNDIIKYLGSDFDNLHNIIYRNNGEIVTTSDRNPDNGFSFPIPLHEQLPLNKYGLPHGNATPLTSVLTSYGCPAICSFCVAGKINYQYRAPSNVISELETIKTLGIKEIFFRDNVFCANRKQGHLLMNMMIENDFGFSWVADTRASILTDETAKIMKKSGCHALHIGVETANPTILKKYNKGVTIEEIRDAFRICKNWGIKTVGYFIIGLPGEMVEDIKKTIDLSIELDCDYASFNVALPIIGTELREEAVKNNWVNSKNSSKYDGSFEPKIESENISLEKILEMRDFAVRKFYLRPSYIVKQLISLRNFYQVKSLFNEFFNLLHRQFKTN